MKFPELEFFELKIPPLLLLFISGVVALGMALTFKGSEGILFDDPALLSVAVILSIAGLYFVSAGVMEFKKHQTTVDPINPGNVSSIVTTGIYGRTRNPMYVGFVLMLAAWCLALGVVQTLWLLPMFVLYLNELQIKPEEQILSEKHPDEFTIYCEEVRRWW